MEIPQEHPTKGNHYLSKIMNDWLPLPEALLKELDWNEGDQIELFQTHGQIIARKVIDLSKPSKT